MSDILTTPAPLAADAAQAARPTYTGALALRIGTGSALNNRTGDTRLGTALDAIRTGAHAEAVATLRQLAADGAEKRTLQEYKRRNLPGYLFHGTFAKRADAAIRNHSGLLVLDFDLADHPAGIDRQAVEHDRHSLAVFASPSGGLKVLMRSGATDADTHGRAFAAAAAYWRKHYNLQADASGKDLARLCYASHDPDLHYNPAAATLPIPAAPPQREATSTPPRDTPRHELTTDEVAAMLAAIPARPAYGEWLRILSAVFDALPYADALHALQTWSPEEQPGEYAAKYPHRLTEVTAATLVHMAQQNGYAAPRDAGRALGWSDSIGGGAGESAPGASAQLMPPPTPRDFIRAAKEPEAYPDLVPVIAGAITGAERGAGSLFARAFRGRYLYDHTNKQWMRYAGGRWEIDETQQIIPELGRFCQQVFATRARALQAEIDADMAAGKLAPADAEKDPRAKAVKAAWQAFAALNKRQTVKNAVGFAGDDLPCLLTDFDADPLLLNCRNGTLDLRTGTLRPHSPRDLCRKMAQAAYDPAARCPKWREFIRTITCGDADLARYLQALLGTGVSGLTDWDFTGFCIGNGANGKSTLFDILLNVLGDYAVTFSIEMLLGGKDRRDQVASYELCALLGARLALASEIPDGRTFNESLLKDLSGGDTIKARHPYGRPFEFAPTHSLFVFGNHIPKINGTDHGIWSRLKLLPFNHRFPRAGEPGNRARSEVEAELLAERDGILAWLVEGFRMAREGLRQPAAVTAAVTEWRDEADVFGAFVGARCEVRGGVSCTQTDLHSAAREYADAQRQRCPSPHEMKRRLEALGVLVRKTMGIRFYEGICLTENR